MESRTQGSRPRSRTQKNFEAKAKDQGHRRKCSPKKKVFKKFFQAISKKKVFKIFFRRSPREENKKRSSLIFHKVSGVFQQNFNRSRKCYPRAEDRAVFEDLRLRGQGQGLQNVSSRTPPLINSQTPTAGLVKIIRRNRKVRVSNVIKHNGEFTKSPIESLYYPFDIVSPGSQQTENHTTTYDLADNPFMRPEDTKLMANICSFERMEAVITNSTIQSSRARWDLSCAVTEALGSTERILPRHFSCMPETQLWPSAWK